MMIVEIAILKKDHPADMMGGMEEKQRKTPDYIVRAQKNYRKKVDSIGVIVPAGTKDRIAATGESYSAFAATAILERLERIEQQQAPEAAPLADSRPPVESYDFDEDELPFA